MPTRRPLQPIKGIISRRIDKERRRRKRDQWEELAYYGLLTVAFPFIRAYQFVKSMFE